MHRATSVGNVTQNIPPLVENYGGSYHHNDGHRGNSSQTRPDRQRARNYYQRDISFKKLEEIHNMEPDQIICTLEKQEVGFDKMIQEKLSSDKIVLIMRVIKKLCVSAFVANTTKILASLCCPEFLNQLKSYLQDINLQDKHEKFSNKYFWSDTNQFWETLTVFYETVLKVRPNMACDSLPKLLKVTITTIRDFTDNVQENVKEKLEDIQVKLMMCQEERERKKVVEQRQRNGTADEYPEPPDDFR